MTKRLCEHCGGDVWWAFARPTDPCFECGKEIGDAEAAMANWFVREIDRRTKEEEARLDEVFAKLGLNRSELS